MRLLRADGAVLADPLEVSADPRIGLLGRAGLVPGAGLLLANTRAIHTQGLTFPIDVLFLGERGTVLAIYTDVQPGMLLVIDRAGRHAIELPAGSTARAHVQPGEQLRLSY